MKSAAVTVQTAMVIESEGLGEVSIRVGKSEVRAYFRKGDEAKAADVLRVFWGGTSRGVKTTLAELRRPCEEGHEHVLHGRAIAAAFRAWSRGKA